ncbi:uncharacterized protein LOC110862878 [Folsomia candida]|uniref:Uncharacterized protein n=1 Tax=Folsomia candida TaxID=158441 RepID=A0A226CW73_FOLCA|nr:uncharacterized protein LOC110862878 [Folsomia candida]OXA36768.1 hypothetical protein Fcan01_28469 [Folsomia candida]
MAKTLLVLLLVTLTSAGLLPTAPVTLPPISIVDQSIDTGPLDAKANITFQNNELDYDVGEWVNLSELPGPIHPPVNQSMQALGAFGENSWAVMNGSLSIPGCYNMWQVNGALGLITNNVGGSLINCLYGNQLLTVLLDPTLLPTAYFIQDVPKA